MRFLYFVFWFVSVVFVAGSLLVVNSVVTFSVISSLPDKYFASGGGEKIMQAIMLVVPVALVFLQFRLYDLFVDLISKGRTAG